MITVPEAFAAAAVTRDGDAGRAWVRALPQLVAELCAEWRLVVDGPVLHGYLGLVIPVRRASEPCALKVSWIDESTADEAAALASWGGRGAVRLLEAQPARGALLLERLDHTRSLATLEIGAAVAVAGGLLRRLAIPAPPGFRPLQEVVARLERELPERWAQAGRPMPRRLLDRARALAAELGASASGLLVNYDLHYDDVLAGRREPWLAVDPKVVAGDVEFGVAQLLWRRLEEMQAQGGLERHFRALAEAAGLDLERARGWTLVRCVDYWLWGLSVGLTEDPARCATIIDTL
ncbi:MAG TPA: aminoglycoside phosphotransferase family protein [Roseiflexaceae bacterium]|nr:aminoglycoside phosphotransferase family protein [Roseiflexaceae bacterium]